MSVLAPIRATLERETANAGLPGVVAAARLPCGERLDVAVGVRGVDDPSPMTLDTPFWIASCTKALTATAALSVVEEGLIGLDDPVGTFVSELAAPKILTGFDAEGRPQLRAANTPITLRHLLAHTSGLAYGFTSALVNRYLSETKLPSVGAAPLSIPLLFEPGEAWIYGIGLDWAAAVLEAVVRQPFETLMKKRVLQPLGMDHTSFFRSAEQTARTAPMHFRTPDGSLAAIPFELPTSAHGDMGGGGLYSTVGDYMRFADFILGFGPHILGSAHLEQLCAVEREGPELGVLKSAQPTMSNDFDPFPGQPRAWSLGFVSNLGKGVNGRSPGSVAWAGLSNCYYWIDRDAKTAGVLFAQLMPFADKGALEVFGAFERAVYAA